MAELSADQTVRFRADYPFVYARALLALTELARAGTTPPFSFGPADQRALHEQGLVVTGQDITAPAELLRRDPGLTEVTE
jgi:hypothetical protein